ncbi:hypothetical protein J1N35_034392 [Gossypium stocksii]|uniref:Uncharacterized protein n=1 Tax=Gossypium stocksii TaxID=47602 RepID=A0A9D3URZ3_9ROSI|nr:hypothetical protein J1N35_034392 [Gossypium stocksii]
MNFLNRVSLKVIKALMLVIGGEFNKTVANKIERGTKSAEDYYKEMEIAMIRADV